MDIERFMGKPKKYDIEGEVVELRPLKGKDLDLFTGLESDGAAGVRKLVHYVISTQICSDVTIEQVEQFTIGSLNAWAEAITDVNGLAKK